jgi:proline iminopeptidase
MAHLYPPTTPYRHGMLDVGDGQNLYWEECGTPLGTPVVGLHGGPGSGCSSGLRQLFDPSRYRIVLFDQRGAGRSTPRVDAVCDPAENTTWHLVADLTRLREHLGVDRWLVYGVSWGSTLGLAYAQLHPDHVLGMVLSSVTMTRASDIHWLFHETGRFYPEAWQRFRDGVPADERDGDLVDAYHRLLNVQVDRRVRVRAARDWCAWEDAASPLPDGRPNPRYDDPGFRITFARLVTHYFHHRAWLEENQLLEGASALNGVPGVLVHGRHDLGGPPDTAWELAHAWPDAQLLLVDTGHAGGQAMTAAIVGATDRFAGRR